MFDHTPRTTAKAATLVPSSTLAFDLAAVVGGATLTTLASQVAIPWQPVPITLQTMAVMLCGLTLGARRGALSQLAYLAAGAAGAPVFAGWSGGPAHLFGPTGGYLAGFVVVAGLLGWLAEKGWDRKFLLCGAALTLAIFVQLSLGTAWLAAYAGWKAALLLGFVPFIGIEAVKAAAVAALMPIVGGSVGR
jgi:biotin transport system substrate-specific component